MEAKKKFDKQAFIQEASQCLFSSLQIEEALHSSISYLQDFLPLDIINAGISDDSPDTLRYLAVATAEAGFLLDERIRFSPEAIDDMQTFKLGSVKIDNSLSSSKVAQEASAHLETVGIEFPKFRGKKEHSTMTLTIGLGKPYAAFFNLVAYGQNRYTDAHSNLLKLLEKPFTGAILNLIHYRDVLSRNEKLEKVNADLRNRLGHTNATRIIGAETGLKAVLKKVHQVALTDSPVLLTGETGTGKELAAHAIHEMSLRANQPIVCINCGAIAESLVDSELFGHEKGAFTGAGEKKRGYFEQADGGTIFLDEVAELPASVQVKLLRILQEKRFHRVGGQSAISIDARVIAATHKNLSEMVKNGSFRSDLWFRLNVFPIHLPPLRERREDIPEMAKHFAKSKAAEMNLPFQPVFASGAMEQLRAYAWPGNIRELQNLIERSLIISGGFPLTFPELTGKKSDDYDPGSSRLGFDVFRKLDDMIVGHIQKALHLSQGKIEGHKGAADLLGLHPSTLRGKMRKYRMGI